MSQAAMAKGHQEWEKKKIIDDEMIVREKISDMNSMHVPYRDTCLHGMSNICIEQRSNQQSSQLEQIMIKTGARLQRVKKGFCVGC